MRYVCNGCETSCELTVGKETEGPRCQTTPQPCPFYYDSFRCMWVHVEGSLGGVEYISCPFCNEDDFDKIGLTIHLRCHCEVYANTSDRDEPGKDDIEKIASLLEREKSPSFTQCLYLSMIFHGWLPDFENKQWVTTCIFGRSLSHTCAKIDSYTIDSRDDTGKLDSIGMSSHDMAMRAWNILQTPAVKDKANG